MFYKIQPEAPAQLGGSIDYDKTTLDGRSISCK